MTKIVNVRLTSARYEQLLRFLTEFNAKTALWGGIPQVEALERIIRRAGRCKHNRRNRRRAS